MKAATIRATVLAVAVIASLSLAPQDRTAAPVAQSFAARIEQLSEEGGDFDTDNLISNERSYLDVVPALKSGRVSGGAYIGVGPDQNFSYIAQIRPAIAFIIDVRRDNLLLHLLFKALFAAAPSRVEYLCLLTSRPLPDRLEGWHDANLQRLVDYIGSTQADRNTLPQLDRRLRDLIGGFGVPLGSNDYATIERFHHAFTDAGLGLKFESRGRPPRDVYPTYRDLLMATDRAGRSWNFLASEADYKFVRAMQARDLIVPVVGDLGGTRALAAIAAVMGERGDHLSAFYISNVETYLYGGKYSQFVNNVRRLPHDAASVLIRSTFRASVSASEVQSVNQFVAANR